MRASLYGPWCSIVQRPHHLARLLSERCSSLDVYTVKRQRYNSPELDFDANVHKRTLMPGPLNKIAYVDKFISRYDAYIEEQVCKDFFQAGADISIYYGRPQDLSKKTPITGKFVYDCVDDFEGFDSKLDPNFQTWERELCERADYIWVVSKRLVEKMSRYSEKVRYIPNGVSFEHFSAAHPIRQARRSASPGRPCLIYVGAIYDWFDVELVARVADLLPEWDIKLIGPVALSKSRLGVMSKSNIQLLGVKDYQSLPGHLALADVTMIPFRLNRLTEATSPIKMYEYLASGLPVVTTPMVEVLPYRESGVVYCEHTPDAFAEAVREAYSSANASRCQTIGESSSWAGRFSPVLTELGLAP